jgi:hypothetical protein
MCRLKVLLEVALYMRYSGTSNNNLNGQNLGNFVTPSRWHWWYPKIQESEREDASCATSPLLDTPYCFLQSKKQTLTHSPLKCPPPSLLDGVGLSSHANPPGRLSFCRNLQQSRVSLHFIYVTLRRVYMCALSSNTFH